MCELGGHNIASAEMHLEALIELVWRYALRCNENLEAEIEWDSRHTRISWSSEIGGVLGHSQYGGGHFKGR
jgi:hypothetical protein